MLRADAQSHDAYTYAKLASFILVHNASKMQSSDSFSVGSAFNTG
jgi:hypothetical protein